MPLQMLGAMKKYTPAWSAVLKLKQKQRLVCYYQLGTNVHSHAS